MDQSIEAAGQQFCQGASAFETVEQDLHGRRDGGGQDHADDAPQHAPDHECQQDRNRMQLERITHNLRLDHIATDELDQAADGGVVEWCLGFV